MSARRITFLLEHVLRVFRLVRLKRLNRRRFPRRGICWGKRGGTLFRADFSRRRSALAGATELERTDHMCEYRLEPGKLIGATLEL